MTNSGEHSQQMPYQGNQPLILGSFDAVIEQLKLISQILSYKMIK